MQYGQSLQPRWPCIVKCAAIGILIFLAVATCAAQATRSRPNQSNQPNRPAQSPITGELDKYPGLLPEFGRVFERLQKELQFPPARSQSRLLPLLPESTVFYAAFPNYSDAAHQTLTIFHQELQASPVLRDWWQRGELAAAGPKIEDSLEKFYQVSQYLGEEIIVSGAKGNRDPSLLMIAEVRRPGLKERLQEIVKELAGTSKPAVRLLDPQDLATVEERRGLQELLVLVRPDFVVGASDLATLRSFNARLNRGNGEFASTSFGQRVAQAYAGGVTVLGAADVHNILSQVPSGSKQDHAILQRSGFAESKYFVWEHTTVAGQPVSQAELSFNGPRHGVASWLAAPAQLGSLDFVSPQPTLVASVVLRNPAQIFEEIEELATASNPNAFASLEQMEQGLQLDLKEDLLRYLAGEITLEVVNVNPPAPAWKAILRVNDPNRLQQTLSRLLAATRLQAEQIQDGGVTYYSVRIASPKTTFEIGYAFVDGYLVIGSSQETVANAVRLHRTGGSLGKSSKFLASLPPGHSSAASAIFYQDPIAMTALRLRQIAPEAAESLAQISDENKPAVACFYAEETAIREVSTSPAFDAGAVAIVAAIAIPNLMRARMAANEASAVGNIRAINVAQIMHASAYPHRGYAPDLATLGLDPSGAGNESAKHAGFLDTTLWNGSCTAGTWCTKSGFRFRITALCRQQRCNEFVVVGTPVSSNTGGRSFCSTSEDVIRFKIGVPLTAPISVSQCRTWKPLQ